ncbi:MAG: hypothetical protein ACMG6E_08550 [Candidatus Roizmanbacteria bacterium]
MNELIQTHRVNPNVLEALLKCFSLLSSQSFDKVESAETVEPIVKDLIILFERTIEHSQCSTPQEESLFDYTLLNFINLQHTFPKVLDELNRLLSSYSERVITEAVPHLFTINPAT